MTLVVTIPEGVCELRHGFQLSCRVEREAKYCQAMPPKEQAERG